MVSIVNNPRPGDEGQRDRLRLDYEQTNQYVRMLIGLRTQPLTMLPALTGASIALLDKAEGKDTILAVGVFGLFVTLGFIAYEMRIARLHAAATRRAKHLERSLGLLPLDKDNEAGGLYTDEPQRLELFKESKSFTKLTKNEALVVRPEHVFSWVYSVALGGWIYLTVHSLVELVFGWQRLGVVSSLASILLAGVATFLFHRSTQKIEKPQ